MSRLLFLTLACMLLAPSVRAEPIDELREQVRLRETAFAKTMADRDHEAFKSFVAEDAVFLSGTGALRGRSAIADGWKPLYETPEAPFSWVPETVEVLDSGNLAISTGPVYAPNGDRAGTFNSTWRREKDGSWMVVLDNGCPACDCGKTEK